MQEILVIILTIVLAVALQILKKKLKHKAYNIDKQYKTQEQLIPYYDSNKDIWRCNFPERDIPEEFGCIEYVTSEFTSYGLMYHYYTNGTLDHEHTFSAVLASVMDNYNTFSIKGYEYEYSKQEIEVINKLIEKIKLVKGSE